MVTGLILSQYLLVANDLFLFQSLSKTHKIMKKTFGQEVKLKCNDLLLREIFIKFGDKNGNKNY